MAGLPGDIHLKAILVAVDVVFFLIVHISFRDQEINVQSGTRRRILHPGVRKQRHYSQRGIRQRSVFPDTAVNINASDPPGNIDPDTAVVFYSLQRHFHVCKGIRFVHGSMESCPGVIRYLCQPSMGILLQLPGTEGKGTEHLRIVTDSLRVTVHGLFSDFKLLHSLLLSPAQRPNVRLLRSVPRVVLQPASVYRRNSSLFPRSDHPGWLE